MVSNPAVTIISSVSVLADHVTVEPVKVVPFNFVTTVAPTLSVVYESVSVAFVEFVLYAVTSLSNVGLNVSEPNANAVRFGVKKPLWYPNPCIQLQRAESQP